MKNKLFEKIIVGNENGEPLPDYRKEQFLTLLRDNYAQIFGVGSLFFCFLLPAIIFQIVMSFQLSALSNPSLGDILSWILLTDGCLVPLCLIGGLGFAGIFGYFKRLVRGESHDIGLFFQAIKEIWGKALFLGLMVGLAIFGEAFSWAYYLHSGWQDYLKYLALGGTTLLFALILVYAVVGMEMALFYESKFGAWLQNTFIFALKRLLPYLGLILLLALCYFSPFFLPGVWQVLGVLILSFLLGPIILLIISEYSAFAFDMDINKKAYPDSFRKGLNQHRTKE